MKLLTFACMVAMAAASAPVAAQQPAGNEKLSRDDPNYVKCRRMDVTGSLAKKTRVCRTNAEWIAAARQGSDAAQDIMQRNMEGSSTNGN